MTHATGITATQTLIDEFNAADQDGTCWLQIHITDDEKFTLHKKCEEKGLVDEALFASVKPTLEDKIPVYTCMKQGEKWLMAKYVPDNSSPKQRMIYAASVSALKTGLGGSKFYAIDFQITLADEMTFEEYSDSINTDRENVMSFEEKEKRETAKHSAHQMGTNQTAVLAGVPIKFSDDAEGYFDQLKAGEIPSMELVLDTEEEIISIGKTDSKTVADILNLFPEAEPRYFLQMNEHKDREGNDGKKLIFVYYCPSKAPPKMKMVYSTCKRHIMACLKAKEFGASVNIECNTKDEFTEEIVMDEMYPKAAVDTTFKKPKARSKARRPMKKFTA